jgi:hypothetical protein
LRYPEHIVEKLILGVSAKIGRLDFFGRKIGHQRLEIFDTVIGKAHGAGGKAAIATVFLLGRPLENKNPGPLIGGRQGRAKRRIAGTDDDHISIFFAHRSFHGSWVFDGSPKKLEAGTRLLLKAPSHPAGFFSCSGSPHETTMQFLRRLAKCQCPMSVSSRGRRRMLGQSRHDIRHQSLHGRLP